MITTFACDDIMILECNSVGKWIFNERVNMTNNFTGNYKTSKRGYSHSLVT